MLLSIIIPNVYATDIVAQENNINNTINQTSNEISENNNKIVGNTGENIQDTSATEEDKWILSDYINYADDVVIDKIVDGNAFVMGNKVTVKGEIGGNLFVLANELIVESTAVVYSSIFACANNIQFNGACYDMFVSCSNFTMGEQSYISRDLKIASNVFNLNGTTRRNIFASVETINMQDTAIVNGNLEYTAKTEQNINKDNIIGEVKFTEYKAINNATSYIVSFVSSILFTLVITLFVIFLAPKFANTLSEISIKKIGITIGIGILSIMAFIIAFIALLCTGIASNIALLLLGIMTILMLVSNSIAYIIIGKTIAKKMKWEGKGKELLIILAITAIVLLINFIPVVGPLLTIIFMLLGLGNIITAILPIKNK